MSSNGRTKMIFLTLESESAGSIAHHQEYPQPARLLAQHLQQQRDLRDCALLWDLRREYRRWNRCCRSGLRSSLPQDSILSTDAEASSTYRRIQSWIPDWALRTCSVKVVGSIIVARTYFSWLHSSERRDIRATAELVIRMWWCKSTQYVLPSVMQTLT